jgi:hypothetical protein
MEPSRHNRGSNGHQTGQIPARQLGPSALFHGRKPQQEPALRAGSIGMVHCPSCGQEDRPRANAASLVSSTVKDIVAGSGIGFEERGEQELDGVPGAWRLFTARI